MTDNRAVSAASFSASIGINTHLDEIWSSYGNTSTVIDALHYLGVAAVRDSMAGSGDPALFSSVASATGVKFDVYLSQSSVGMDAQIAAMQSALSVISAVEGVNEGDTISGGLQYAGQSGYAAIAAAQTSLYNAFASTGTEVIGPSYGNLADYVIAPNTTAVSQYGNVHEYAGTGNPPIGIPGNFLPFAARVANGEPVIATEAGYYTGPSLSGSVAAYQHSGVSETVQAKYDLTLAFDDWKAGIKNTYFYELLDRNADPNNTNAENHFGLFHADGTPKLAATAVRNLMLTLADTGTPRTDSFGYQIAGAAPAADWLLLEKSTGVFDLAVWNDIRLADSVTAADLTSPITPVTIAFGQTVQSVREIDPLFGAGAVQSWSNVSSIAIDLPDHPVLFEITPAVAQPFTLKSFVVPETVASGSTSDNLWSTLLADASGGTGAITIAAVGTSTTRGTLAFDPASASLRYTAPTYTPLQPTDSFTVTLQDGTGAQVTGTVAITETPPPDTLYDLDAGARLNAPASGYTLVSLAKGQQLYSDFGGVNFVGSGDTAMYGGTSGNSFTAGDGNHTIGAGGNARITLGNGNNVIGLSGAGNVITTGNGDNLFWKSTGTTSITTGDGNQNITAGGLGNVITVGVGNSTINVGTDGAPAGNETVVVGGGTNTLNVNGDSDSITLRAGSSKLVSQGGSATITIGGGTNNVVAQGASATITIQSGNNTVLTSGAKDVIRLGSGNDVVWAGGDSSQIFAGSGAGSIDFVGTGDTIDLTRGAVTVQAQGSGATLILAAVSAASTPSQIFGNVFAAGDTLDLRVGLAATGWDGKAADIADYHHDRLRPRRDRQCAGRDGAGIAEHRRDDRHGAGSRLDLIRPRPRCSAPGASMKVIGLTGGIGMGKSTAAAALRRAGLPVFDADAAVHALQGRGGAAVRPIGAAFPGTVRDGAVDRQALRAAVLGNDSALTRLERIVHPLVRRVERQFLARARRAGRPLAVLDIPLLFETGGERRVDHVVVVSAPAAVQRARVRRRRTMSAAQIEAVIARQMPDREKRRRADTVIQTGLSRHHAERQLRRLVRRLR